MHELSLISSVMETVKEGARENNITRVSKVKLVIGKLSQALPDSLQFAFSALASQEALFLGACIEIEERDIRCTCLECDSEFNVEDGYSFICPHCQGQRVDIVSGRELFIDYFEGDA